MDRGFEDTSLKDGSNKLFETHNILEALLDKEMLGDDPETLDSELHEQESIQRNYLGSNIKINDDHVEDGSRNTAIREHDQDIESVKEDVETEDKSSMDELENNMKESNKMKQIMRKRNPESKFGMNSKEVDQSSRNNYDDINTGRDKCFIALGREMSGNEYQDIHDIIASTANDNVPHEERGNRADDEKDSERIINSPEPVDLDQELDKLEMIEKTKRILGNSDKNDQSSQNCLS